MSTECHLHFGLNLLFKRLFDIFLWSQEEPLLLKGAVDNECRGMYVQEHVAVNTSLNISQQELGQEEQTFSFLGRKNYCSDSVDVIPSSPKSCVG